MTAKEAIERFRQRVRDLPDPWDLVEAIEAELLALFPDGDDNFHTHVSEDPPLVRLFLRKKWVGNKKWISRYVWDFESIPKVIDYLLETNPP